MKKSITAKIIISYLVIILVSLMFVGVFFSFTAANYMERKARNSLKSDALAVVNVLNKDINIWVKTADLKNRPLIREKIRRAVRASNSSFAIINKDFKVLHSGNSEVENIFEEQVVTEIKEQLIERNKTYTKFYLDDKEYMGYILPVQRGWILLYTPVDPVKALSEGFLVVLFISLGLTAFLALTFGVFFAKSIAKPIIILKNRAEMLSKRDFDSRVDINTGDELEELGHTINKMASELKEYDIAQKKFLQNASHELKTPLMSIQGYAEGIKDGVFEDDDKALHIIVDESARLKCIVDELILLSKLETMEDYYKFSIESINEIIEDSIEKVNSLAIKNDIKINLMLYKDANIRVDRHKFIQALINILGNCIRHAKSEVNVITASDGQWFEIRITDDGEGFRQGEMDNVFKRFYKGDKGQTGLGLAITKVIIEKHGGTIEVKNNIEGGAEFKIRLKAD